MRVDQIGDGLSRIFSRSPVNHGPIIGKYRAPLLDPNRDKRYPIIGVLYTQISDRVRCGKNEAFLFSIMGLKEDRLDWRRAVHDFIKIPRKAWAAHRKLSDQSPRP